MRGMNDADKMLRMCVNDRDGGKMLSLSGGVSSRN